MKIAPKMDENANIDDTYDDVKVLSTGLKLQQLYPTITLPKGYKGPELRIRDVIQKVETSIFLKKEWEEESDGDESICLDDLDNTEIFMSSFRVMQDYREKQSGRENTSLLNIPPKDDSSPFKKIQSQNILSSFPVEKSSSLSTDLDKGELERSNAIKGSEKMQKKSGVATNKNSHKVNASTSGTRILAEDTFSMFQDDDKAKTLTAFVKENKQKIKLLSPFSNEKKVKMLTTSIPEKNSKNNMLTPPIAVPNIKVRSLQDDIEELSKQKCGIVLAQLNCDKL